MMCPYCGAPMEESVIESSEPINFIKEVRFVNKAKKKLGEFNLATPTFGGRASVTALLCRNCRNIMISY